MNHANQTGFSLVTAVFVLVVMGLVGMYMVTLTGTQRATTVMALQGARALQAARSGVEWGAHQAFFNTPAACSAAPGATTTTMSLGGVGLNGFTVDVQCSYTAHREQGDDFCVFHVDAVARSGSLSRPQDHVQRRVRTTVTNLNLPGSPCP